MEVDGSALERQFRELSLKLHPDRVATGDVKVRRLSLEQTTALNEAFKTLKDPVRRAFYLLKLEGRDLDREDAGAQKDMPLEFLEEVMTLREGLEGLQASKDLAAAQKMAADVSERSRAALNEGNAALGARLVGDRTDASLARAAHALARVRYFTRFLEEVEHMEEEALK